MTNEQLNKYEKVQKNKIPRLVENEKYVLGKNPGIEKDPKKRKPDNRIAVPLAKSAVEDMTGFAASPGNITFNWDESVDDTEAERTERKEYIEIQREILDYNNAYLETSELYNQALTQGESYELFWISGDDQNVVPEFAMVDNREIVLIWDGGIKPKLLAAIRYFTVSDVKYSTVYYPGYAEGYKKIKDIWYPYEENDTTYPYKQVPLSVYKINRTSQPLFEAEKKLIDAEDNIISKSTDEVDRFNAQVLMSPDKVDEDFVKDLNNKKIIDGLSGYDKWPEYLKKDMQGITQFYNDMSERYIKLFHTSIKVPDFTDKNFAGTSSGIAIEYKVMGMEIKASSIDAYFNQGLIKRNELINDVINVGVKKYPEYGFTITSKRNLPVDVKNNIEGAAKLVGMVSKETLLKYLPNQIVEDVDVELERLENEILGIDLNE